MHMFPNSGQQGRSRNFCIHCRGQLCKSSYGRQVLHGGPDSCGFSAHAKQCDSYFRMREEKDTFSRYCSSKEGKTVANDVITSTLHSYFTATAFSSSIGTKSWNSIKRNNLN